MLIDDLLTTLFDGKPHPLTESMATWLGSSRRFAAFVSANHTKIRKKLRTAQDLESMRDLQLELETAYLLLRERSLSLAYEPQHPSLGRSPDFEVRFTTKLAFMVEVTRLRTAGGRATEATATGTPLSDRFYNLLCSKLGQLLPQRGNVLVVGVEDSGITHADLQAGMVRLQQRAEANDPAVVQKQGFRDRSNFFQRYYRLSAVLVRDTSLEAGSPAILWANPQAKFPLPSRVYTAL